MKIALVHDYLNQMGGAENVLEEFISIFPDAPVYTSILDKSKLRSSFSTIDVQTSFLQNLPFIKHHFKKYLPLFPLAFEKMNLKGFDVILSMSSGFAKGVSFSPGTLHINYCLTPMRFAWMFKQYDEKEKIPIYFKLILYPILNNFKQWDLKKNENVHRFIALSTAVQKRIKEWYNRDSDIIYPPVDVDRFIPGKESNASDYFLIVSRLRGYKRIDIAIEACNYLKMPLKIVGSGEAIHGLKKLAGSTIEFLGHKSDEDIVSLMQQCKAFIFPGEEDFGIAPLEAQACGRPVVAFRAGGALDTIINGKTGFFFENQNVEALVKALNKCRDVALSSIDCRENALRFSKNIFRLKIKEYVENALYDFKKIKAHA